jgi:hypothetical protein
LLLFLPVAYFFHIFTTIAIMRFCRNVQVELYSHISASRSTSSSASTWRDHSRLNSDVEAQTAERGHRDEVLVGPSLLLYSMAMMFLDRHGVGADLPGPTGVGVRVFLLHHAPHQTVEP